MDDGRGTGYMSRQITSFDFRRNLGAMIDVAHGGESLIVMRHGRAHVALIAATEYERLRAIEDAVMEDARHRGVMREAEASRGRALSEGVMTHGE